MFSFPQIHIAEKRLLERCRWGAYKYPREQPFVCAADF
jgi:hypothetical protein